MCWIIAGVVVLVAIVIAVVIAKRAAAKEEERRRRKLDTIRRKLKPGVRFEAYGSFGNKIKGEVIKVIDSKTIEAWCKAYDDQPGETGRFPIDRIYKVSG